MARDWTLREGGTRVLPATRLLAAGIVPFLVVGWGILYLLPAQTERLFAWPVQPTMTAMLLGSAYLGGAYFFVRSVRARAWEEIALGFLPVAAFATLMGVATILHWDRFTAGHIAFYVWTALYFTTPFLVLGVWWANQREVHPGAHEGWGGAVLSRGARVAAASLGVLAVVIALALFIWPQQLIEVWPWTLTPLTARVVAAIFVLGGAGIGVARDPRWGAVRLLVQVTWVMLGLIALATVRAWNELDHGSPLTWLFVGWLVAVLAGSVLLYRTMEHRSRLQRLPPG